MNDSYGEYVSDFDSFWSEYKEKWNELVRVAEEKVDTEKLTMVTAAQNPFQWGEAWDGAGQISRVGFNNTQNKFEEYIDTCCFPDLNCSKLTKAIETLETENDKFNIIEPLGNIRIGLDSWNTEDKPVDKYAELGVAWGPAELFKHNYVNTIDRVELNQRDLVTAAAERYKGLRRVAKFNRSAILKILDDTIGALEDYNPWEDFLIATIHVTFAALGLAATPVGALGAVVGDIVVTKGLNEIGIAEDVCVVGAFEELRNSIDKLAESRSEAIAKLIKDIDDLYDEVHKYASTYVCKRPSLLGR